MLQLFLSRVCVFLCRSGMCCTFILFYFIFNLFHITTRQSYTKNHGIRRNTSGAMDSLNTQHCALLKHRIISRTHIESIQCFRSMQYSITSNVSCVRVHSHPWHWHPKRSVQDNWNTFASETLVQGMRIRDICIQNIGIQNIRFQEICGQGILIDSHLNLFVW